MEKSGQTHADSASGDVLRLGTRGSRLALAQSTLIAEQLMRAHAGLYVQLVTIRTTGDRITDRPLADVGGKGLFTKELEQALLAGTIDFAVHSYKDVPITMPLVDISSLVIAAVPKREDPRDVLITRDGIGSVEELPIAAKVGTGSLRRRCQLSAIRPDLRIEPIRGNIDTRLRKLHDGEHDAIVLALAGLLRAGLFDETRMFAFPVERMVPSPGQGALALQCRGADDRTIGVLRALHDADTALCVDVERDVVARLNGDCHSPIAALATVERDSIHLRTAVGEYDGVGAVRRAALSEIRALSNLLAQRTIDRLQ